MPTVANFALAAMALAISIASSVTHAQALVQPPSGSPINVWVPVIASAVGALIALLTMFLKDFIVVRWIADRERTSAQRDILRNYVAPLASACSRLVWRFKETFIDGGHQWLLLATSPFNYNEYKRISTLYRIASLLGWIRAINLELSALPRGASGFLTPISDAIAAFQSALADGENVELRRLEQLCSVWRLNLARLPEDRKKILATRLEVTLYSLAGDGIKKEPNILRNIPDEEQLRICTGVSGFLCTSMNQKTFPPDILKETLNQAINAMSYREALIYRTGKMQSVIPSSNVMKILIDVIKSLASRNLTNCWTTLLTAGLQYSVAALMTLISKKLIPAISGRSN